MKRRTNYTKGSKLPHTDAKMISNRLGFSSITLVCLLFTLSTIVLIVECRQRTLVSTYRSAEEEDEDEEGKPCDREFCPWPYECVSEDGEKTCVCPKECPSKLELICTTMKRQFLNECELKRAACRKRSDKLKPYYKGNCYKLDKLYFWKKDCNATCEFERSIEVCGTDGKTYKHPCKLVKAICKSGSKEKQPMLDHPGPCDKKEEKDKKDKNKPEE